jgi:hypothetical protein
MNEPYLLYSPLETMYELKMNNKIHRIKVRIWNNIHYINHKDITTSIYTYKK